jgi:hypothetical protein
MSGNVIVGKVKLKNDGDKPEKVLIYQQELVLVCGKEQDFSDVKANSHSLSEWMRTNVDEKVLSAGEEYDMIYTITIPANSAHGSYWNVIMIEGADPVVTSNDNMGLQINSKVRYAVQVIADIGEFESPTLTYTAVKIKNNAEGKRVVDVLLKNEGEFSVKAKVLLEVYSEKGEKIKVLTGTTRRIYPKQCNNFEIEIASIAKGKYDGVVVADNGSDLFGSNVVLVVE